MSEDSIFSDYEFTQNASPEAIELEYYMTSMQESKNYVKATIELVSIAENIPVVRKLHISI